MEQILNIPGVSIAINLIMIIVFGAFVYGATKDFLTSLKNYGFKKSMDELLIIVVWLLVGIFVINNLLVVARLADIILNGAFRLFEALINFIFGGS